MGTPSLRQVLAAAIAIAVAAPNYGFAQSQRLIDAIIRNEDEMKMAEPPAGQLEYQRWESCVIDRAKRFAGSSEAADLVVRGSLAACQNHKKELSTAMFKAGVKAMVALEAIKMMEKDLTDLALVGILELRTRR